VLTHTFVKREVGLMGHHALKGNFAKPTNYSTCQGEKRKPKSEKGRKKGGYEGPQIVTKKFNWG